MALYLVWLEIPFYGLCILALIGLNFPGSSPAFVACCAPFFTHCTVNCRACQALILNLTHQIVDYLCHLLPDWS